MRLGCPQSAVRFDVYVGNTVEQWQNNFRYRLGVSQSTLHTVLFGDLQMALHKHFK